MLRIQQRAMEKRKKQAEKKDIKKLDMVGMEEKEKTREKETDNAASANKQGEVNVAFTGFETESKPSELPISSEGGDDREVVDVQFPPAEDGANNSLIADATATGKSSSASAQYKDDEKKSKEEGMKNNVIEEEEKEYVLDTTKGQENKKSSETDRQEELEKDTIDDTTNSKEKEKD